MTMSPKKSHSKTNAPKSSSTRNKQQAPEKSDHVKLDQIDPVASVEVDMSSKPCLQVRPMEMNPFVPSQQHVALSDDSSTFVDFEQVNDSVDVITDVSTPIDIDDPSSMPENVTQLSTVSGSEIFIVGTAHFSKKSVDDVRKVVSSIKPDAVLLELCPERQFILDLDEDELLRQNSKLSIAAIRHTISEKGLVQGLIYTMFVKMSADLTEKLGMAPGGELRAGAREAVKVPGCLTVLIDRPISITIARAVASATLWQKIKLICHLLSSDVITTQEDVEKCKDKDMLEKLLLELGGEFPGLKRVILDERNIYLAHKLHQFTTDYEARFGPQKIVAVVGIAHVAGMLENWCKTTDDDVKQMSVKPESGKGLVVVAKTIKYCSIALLIYVGYRTLTPSGVQTAIHSRLFCTRR